MDSEVKRCVAFLESIGLSVRIIEKVPEDSFLTTVYIDCGTLCITAQASVSDLLHEAGHVALIPSKYRLRAKGDLYEALTDMWDEVFDTEPEDSPIWRAAMQCGDTEATAWAWAAGTHLGYKHEDIINTEQYDGDGDEIRFMLNAKQYFGIHGLMASGMTTKATYPTLTKWLAA